MAAIHVPVMLAVLVCVCVCVSVYMRCVATNCLVRQERDFLHFERMTTVVSCCFNIFLKGYRKPIPVMQAIALATSLDCLILFIFVNRTQYYKILLKESLAD